MTMDNDHFPFCNSALRRFLDKRRRTERSRIQQNETEAQNFEAKCMTLLAFQNQPERRTAQNGAELGFSFCGTTAEFRGAYSTVSTEI
jgi:hypothetical protein